MIKHDKHLQKNNITITKITGTQSSIYQSGSMPLLKSELQVQNLAERVISLAFLFSVLFAYSVYGQDP